MKTRIAILLAAAALGSCSQDTPDEAQGDEAAGDHGAAVDASAAPAIDVANGWVRSTPGGNDVTAAYFTS